MRAPQQLPLDLRSPVFWIATLAVLLAACLNPRPEELPSAQGLDGAGEPRPGDSDEEGENVAVDQNPAPPAPATPQGGGSSNPPPPSSEPTDSPAADADAGTDPLPDAGTPDAGNGS